MTLNGSACPLPEATAATVDYVSICCSCPENTTMCWCQLTVSFEKNLLSSTIELHSANNISRLKWTTYFLSVFCVSSPHSSAEFVLLFPQTNVYIAGC